MAIRVGDLVNKRKIVVLEWEGETITAVVRPFSDVIRNRVKAKLKDEEAAVYADLEELLIEWDIMGDDGEMYPIRRQEMEALPAEMLILLWRKIIQDLYPNLRSGASTAASSLPRASSEASQGGSQTSESLPQ